MMQYANVMQCMILHEGKCPCIKFISFILSLLGLPLSHPCTLHGSVISVSSFFSLESVSVLTLASRAVSHFSTLGNKHPSCSIL